MTPETLLAAIKDLYEKRHEYINNMEKSEQNNAIERVMEVITSVSK